MNLPKAVARQLKHERNIQIKGYQREDNLLDIEAILVDTKTYTFPNKHRGDVAAGEPVHHMLMRLTMDERMTIKDVAATTISSPFNICPEITENFSVLIGEQIKPGWTKRTRELLGGTKGCTHLLELLGPMATTAFQTIYGSRSQNNESTKKPAMLNSCHAFAESGSVVKEFYPAFYKSK